MKQNLIRASSVLYITIVIIVALSGCGTGSGPTSIPDKLETAATTPDAGLIWSDEFNGTSLDATKWNIEKGYGSGDSGWGNDEWQLYTDSSSNVRVAGGNLVLTARCDSGVCDKRDGSITSARINTKGKFSTKFGKIQARIKTPNGKGMWSAFWMLGTNFDSVGWPKSGEIDIMEMHFLYSNDRTTHTAMHWWDESAAAGSEWTYYTNYKTFTESLSSDYHIYEIDWNEGRIIGKIDGQSFFTRTIDPNTMTEFLNDFFLIFNVAVGGTLGGAPDATTVWPQEMSVDWVRVYGSTPVTPPAAGDTKGIYSETHTNPKLPYSKIINSADWSGNITIPVENSTDVTPKEGSYVLSADYQLGLNKGWGGIAFNFGGVDISDYSALVFSLNSSALTGFFNLGVEFEDGYTKKSQVALSSYTPKQSGNWATYEIPFSAFPTVDFKYVSYLGFYTPKNSSGTAIAGKLYFDDIYLGKVCVGTGSVMFSSANYPADSTSTVFTVSDSCSAGSTKSVAIDNGAGVINVNVSLNSFGNGSSVVKFGLTDDSTDTIAITSGNTITAKYTDANSHLVTGNSAIVDAGVRTVPGDAPVKDGYVYLYATNAATVIDFKGNTNYTKTAWDSGAIHNMAYAADTTYNPIISITPGNGWSPTVYAGAIAFSSFNTGFASPYSTLHFKFKGNYSSINVKFANGVSGPDKENSYLNSSANARSLGNGWYDFSVRLADFPAMSFYTEFAILNIGTDPFYLTDIYFE